MTISDRYQDRILTSRQDAKTVLEEKDAQIIAKARDVRQSRMEMIAEVLNFEEGDFELIVPEDIYQASYFQEVGGLWRIYPTHNRMFSYELSDGAYPYGPDSLVKFLALVTTDAQRQRRTLRFTVDLVFSKTKALNDRAMIEQYFEATENNPPSHPYSEIRTSHEVDVWKELSEDTSATLTEDEKLGFFFEIMYDVEQDSKKATLKIPAWRAEMNDLLTALQEETPPSTVNEESSIQRFERVLEEIPDYELQGCFLRVLNRIIEAKVSSQVQDELEQGW